VSPSTAPDGAHWTLLASVDWRTGGLYAETPPIDLDPVLTADTTYLCGITRSSWSGNESNWYASWAVLSEVRATGLLPSGTVPCEVLSAASPAFLGPGDPFTAVVRNCTATPSLYICDEGNSTAPIDLDKCAKQTVTKSCAYTAYGIDCLLSIAALNDDTAEDPPSTLACSAYDRLVATDGASLVSDGAFVFSTCGCCKIGSLAAPAQY
jgi:hypothetical protein